MKRFIFISALTLLTVIGSGISASADSSPSKRAQDKNQSRAAISLPQGVLGHTGILGQKSILGQGFTSDRGPQRSTRPIWSPSTSSSSARGSFDSPQKMAAVRISPSQAKAIALRHVPGSQYRDMKLIDGMVYRVRVEKDGHRIDVYVDGNTGRVR